MDNLFITAIGFLHRKFLDSFKNVEISPKFSFSNLHSSNENVISCKELPKSMFGSNDSNSVSSFRPIVNNFEWLLFKLYFEFKNENLDGRISMFFTKCNCFTRELFLNWESSILVGNAFSLDFAYNVVHKDVALRTWHKLTIQI